MACRSTFRALLPALALALAMFGGAALAQDDSAIDVELGEWYVDMPSTIPAGPLTLNVSNAGNMGHTLAIEGEGVNLSLGQNLASGDSATMEIDLEPGVYTFYCPVPGHPGAGMEARITVVADGDDPPPAPPDEPTTEASTGDAYDAYGSYDDPYTSSSEEEEPATSAGDGYDAYGDYDDPPPASEDEPTPTSPPATPTTAAAEPTATPQEEQAAAAEATPAATTLTAGTSDDSSGGNTMLIALLAAVAGVVVVGGGWFYRARGRAA